LSERKKKILIFVFFLCVAIFLTGPLLPNFSKAVYGQAGDPAQASGSLNGFIKPRFPVSW
jgi:hypothetical protein